MYKTASICKVEKVWADLKAHGLGNDLLIDYKEEPGYNEDS
jgi:hypothetical protein